MADTVETPAEPQPDYEQQLSDLQDSFSELQTQHDELQQKYDDLVESNDKDIDALKSTKLDLEEASGKIEILKTSNGDLKDKVIELTTEIKSSKEYDVFQDEQISNYQKQVLALQDEINNDSSQTTLLENISHTTEVIADTTDSVLAGTGTVVYYGVFIIPLILFIVFLNWFLRPFLSSYR